MAEPHSSILIVDDDAEDLTSVERALRSLGSDLVSVKDPHDVMPSVHRLRPDVVIVDALLPGLSGFDLCKQIKSDPQLKATQVLILTGVYLRQQYRHEAIQQFKADAFLTKPFRPPELQRLVVQLLARKTRMPQSSFLKRIGLPASSEPKKRGLLGRIFGRAEAEEPAPTRIAPVARDIPQPPPPEAVVEAETPRVESAPEIALEPPKGEAPPPAPEPPKVEAEEAKIDAPAAEVAPERSTEPAPETIVPEPEVKTIEPEPPREAAPVAAPEPVVSLEPEAVAAPPAAPEPDVQAVAVETTASEEPEGAPPPEAAEVEAPPSTVLDAPSPSEAEEVTWIQADSRTQEMTLEEAAARAAEGSLSTTAPEESAAPPAEPEPQAEAKEESLPPADSQPLRRPLFRVGEVPIYDEPDFLTELKRELSKCKRVDRPLTLILIRVGDLRQIVELFGKDFREPVLWHIAEQAMESLREVDLVGMMASKDLIAMTAFASDRYGGGRIVSRMRQAVTKKPFRVGEELPPIIPALDFGMATFPADGSEVGNLMRRAEEDLTNGKSSAAVSD
jgi:diguanylate cyclase (GGDEF)-like protein